MHHQGDIGEASFAAVPHFVSYHARLGVPEWNAYSLASVIELARAVGRNPDLPAWLAGGYRAVWSDLEQMALTDLASAGDPLLVRSALAVVAISKGDRRCGAMLALLDDSEIDEVLQAHDAGAGER